MHVVSNDPRHIMFHCFLFTNKFFLQSLSSNESTGDDEKKSFDCDENLLQDYHSTFNLQTPSPVPVHLNVHYVCESACRLLFLSVHWARSINAFQALRY